MTVRHIVIVLVVCAVWTYMLGTYIITEATPEVGGLYQAKASPDPFVEQAPDVVRVLATQSGYVKLQIVGSEIVYSMSNRSFNNCYPNRIK